MVKGDDAVAKRRNRARSRKQSKDGVTISARIASIIAAKKRRQSGVRRKCQGMCYSLPSIEDPFNDKHGKAISNKKKKTKKTKTLGDIKSSVMGSSGKYRQFSMEEISSTSENNPSKVMSLCLSTIESAMQENAAMGFIKEEETLFSYSWGLDFLKCYTSGRNVLDTSGYGCNPKQIAWVSSVAADCMSRSEKDGYTFSHPFILFLVSSREEAVKVRSVCKCLKSQGFHTISIHPYACISDQIEGLKKIEPEFLVATPDRLLDLISRKAINLSRVAFLVVDETNAFPNSDFLAKVESIKASIQSRPFTVVFSATWHRQNYTISKTLLPDPVLRISSDDSLATLGAFIHQSVDVCSSEHDKLVQCLRNMKKRRENKQTQKALCVVRKGESMRILKKLFMSNNICVLEDEESEFDRDVSCRPVVYITREEHVLLAELESFEVIFLADFVGSEDVYTYIVMRMARLSRSGVLHSFLTEENCLQATNLVRVIKDCGHEVPDCLRSII